MSEEPFLVHSATARQESVEFSIFLEREGRESVARGCLIPSTNLLSLLKK